MTKRCPVCLDGNPVNRHLVDYDPLYSVGDIHCTCGSFVEMYVPEKPMSLQELRMLLDCSVPGTVEVRHLLKRIIEMGAREATSCCIT